MKLLTPDRIPTIIFTLLCCIVVPFFNSPAHAQNKELSAKQWQEDLRFLQKTVHRDYPFLFKKVSADQFNKAVEKLYQEMPQLKQHEAAAGLSRIVSMFGYGHTRLGLERSPLQFHYLPIKLYQFKDGVYVQAAHKKYASALGAKVIDIEGVAIEDAIQKIRPVVPVENDQYMKEFGFIYMRVPEILHAQRITKTLKKSITFKLERDGKTFSQKFEAQKRGHTPTRFGVIQPNDQWLDSRKQGTTPLYLKNLNKIYYFEYLPEHKTLYVRHSQIRDDAAEAIPQFYQRVFQFIENNDVEKLVLDVRLNSGGNNYKNKPIVTGLISCKKINQTGKLFVIIGRRTFSACQNLVNEIDTYTNAIFVGEPTSENINFYGDNRPVMLPNSRIPAYLSFAWWQDKPQWENAPWLAPDLAVESSFEDYQTNRDPALREILNFSKDSFVANPMATLRKLFEAGDMDKLETRARQLITDKRYRYLDLESKINQAGYDLMRSGSVPQAKQVFGLNTKLFPKSANTWDSLAESYLKAGEKEKAIEYYQKVIRMDPKGKTGANARQMLQKIRSGGKAP